MATLHMEVESARSTHTTLTNTHGQLTSDLQTITNSVQGLVGSSWQGNSSTEFLNEYESLKTSITQQLEALNALGTRLQNEINEWEQMAASLN